MNYRLASVWLIVASIAVTAMVSCGKSGDKKPGDGEKASELVDIARMARGGVSLEDEISGLGATMEAAGFKTRVYERFLSQQIGKKGRLLVYEDKQGKPRGGIIYFTMTGNTVSPCWHWYFQEMVPDSVVAVEINEDGLWDLRVVSGKGKVLGIVQEESFTLFGKERDDWIALNGASSSPVSPADALWKAFDGDSTTAWRSQGDAGKSYVELTAPFGVVDGILSVRTLDQDQPKSCTVYADGNQIQQFDLQARAAEQIVRLDSGIQGAKEIRLEFESSHGVNGVVAVAELGLK